MGRSFSGEMALDVEEPKLSIELAQVIACAVVMQSLKEVEHLLDFAERATELPRLHELRDCAIEAFVATQRARTAVELPRDAATQYQSLIARLRSRISLLSRRIPPALC